VADVLVLGAGSLVGSHFVAAGPFACSAAGRHDPRAQGLRIDRFDPVDLTSSGELGRLIRQAPEAAVVNFAGATEVDGIESQRASSSEVAAGPAWEVNALAPEAIAAAARAAGKYFVQISTDFVFDGRSGPYGETDPRSPFSAALSWYGWTKSEGERRTLATEPSSCVVRISYPYRAGFPSKLDFARRLLQHLREGSMPPLYADQQISPTWVPDVTTVLARILRTRPGGVVHVASPLLTTPFEFGGYLAERVGRGGPATIRAGRLADAPPGRAPRPLRGGLQTGRAGELGCSLTSWRVGVDQLVAAGEGGT
jgi:dTDP-4-dehydrorhamnose reductase